MPTTPSANPPAHSPIGTLDCITITGIAAHAYHGVEDFEKKDGQPFSIDVRFWLDTRSAGDADDLHGTINYAEVSRQVYNQLTGRPVDLLETVAHRLALDLLATHSLMQEVEVTVHKPQAPIPVPFTDVTVTVHRTRLDLPAQE